MGREAVTGTERLHLAPPRPLPPFRTRCDPYTNSQLFGVDYNYCCHSNLTRALLGARGEGARGGGKGAVEEDVHDVLNVFMCTGFTRDTSQYFMKVGKANQPASEIPALLPC